MRQGLWYIVTKSSADETFEKGEHIKLDSEGSIICKEAHGWIDKEDVEEAVKGMECRIDKDFIQNQIKTHQDILKNLFNVLEEVEKEESN